MNGPRPGGPKPGGPGNPDPRPPNQERLDRIARLAASPLITEAPPLTDAQRDRLAVLLAPVRARLRANARELVSS